MNRTTTALFACLVNCVMALTGCHGHSGPSSVAEEEQLRAEREVVASLIGVWQLEGQQDGNVFTKYDSSTPVWLEFKADGSWRTESEEPTAPYANNRGKWKYKQHVSFGEQNEEAIFLVTQDSSPDVEEAWEMRTNFKGDIVIHGGWFKKGAKWHFKHRGSGHLY